MKKMLLKGVSLFLVLLMIYSSVPVSVFATVDFTETQTELVTGEETTEPQIEGEEPGGPIEEELPEYSYAVNEDNTLVITAYNGEDKFVTIPATIDEMAVVSIGANAFANNTTILEVTIPEGVTEIGESAFSGCPQLRNVIVPKSVTLISEIAFEVHPNLTLFCYDQYNAHIYAKDNNIRFKIIDSYEETLVFGDITDTLNWRLNLVTGLLNIDGDGAIPDSASNNTELWAEHVSIITGLVLSDGITSIGKYAFQNCSGITGELVIPSGITSIGEYAFQNCSGIKGDLVIPDSVTSIGRYSFNNCSGFDGTLKLSENLTKIPSYAFEGCGGLTGELVIPDSVTTIEEAAFSYYYQYYSGGYKYEPRVAIPGITSIVLGKNLTSMPSSSSYYYGTLYAFTGVKEVIFKGTTVPSRGCSDIFYSMNGLEKVFVPAVSYNEYSQSIAPYVNNARILMSDSDSDEFIIRGTKLVLYQGDGGDIIIPDTVEIIGASAFQNCTTVTSVTFGSNVKSIESYAFDGCSGLSNVIFNDTLESIGSYAFRNCTGLTNLSFNDNLKTIGERAFTDCIGLTNDLTIPESVTSINNYAFANCTGINGKVTIEGNEDGTKIGNYAFNGCTKISSLELGEGITSIGEYAFQNCSGIKGDLVIPDSVTSIGRCSFNNCSGFDGTLKLSENLTKIPSYAFEGCGGLTGELVIPDSVTTIEEAAFSYYYQYYSGGYKYEPRVAIPGITSIVLGKNLTNMPSSSSYYYGTLYAFTGVKEVTFKGTTVPSRGCSDIFYSMNGLESQTVILCEKE